MLQPNDYTMLKDYKLNMLPAVVAEAEQRRVLAEAGLARHPGLSGQMRRLLWRLGRMLAAVGQQLERRYAPMPLIPAQAPPG